MNTADLTDLVETTTTEPDLPLSLKGITLTAPPPPSALENLLKLQKLGILNGDTLLSLVGQAPIDPINLMSTLMRVLPEGWAFSSIDFSMMRTLARDAKGGTQAAMHVDLMGNTIKFLARNRAGQLVVYKDYEVTPGPQTLDEINTLIKQTTEAADRESVSESRVVGR